ncbi:MAG: hypothetical protein WCH76_08075, partial [Candidatus Riflemargulisbacteria bacterium]
MKTKLILIAIALIIIPSVVFVSIYIGNENQWKIYCLSINSAYQSMDKDDLEQAYKDIEKALTAKNIEEKHKVFAETLKKDCEKAKSV